jgi:hypothetical protein
MITIADAATATVFTFDITRALRVASRLGAGTVRINSASATNTQTPFGGMKQSGYGQESRHSSLEEYLQQKTIHINLNIPKRSWGEYIYALAMNEILHILSTSSSYFSAHVRRIIVTEQILGSIAVRACL